jgi:hypothetical protein
MSDSESRTEEELSDDDDDAEVLYGIDDAANEGEVVVAAEQQLEVAQEEEERHAAAAAPPLVEAAGALADCCRCMEASFEALAGGRRSRTVEAVDNCLEAARRMKTEVENMEQPRGGDLALVKCASWLSKCTEQALLAMKREYERSESERTKLELQCRLLQEECDGLKRRRLASLE